MNCRQTYIFVPSLLLCLILTGCAKTYLIHPFPEQKLNDTNTINFFSTANEEYGGWIVIARSGRFRHYVNPIAVYYNGRFIGQAGYRQNGGRSVRRQRGLHLLLSPGTYTAYATNPDEKPVTFTLPFKEEKQEDTNKRLNIICAIPAGTRGFGYFTSKAKRVYLVKINTIGK